MSLIKACRRGKTRMVNHLLLNGADVNKRSGNGYDAIYYAVKSNNINLVYILLQYSVDVNKTYKLPVYKYSQEVCYRLDMSYYTYQKEFSLLELAEYYKCNQIQILLKNSKYVKKLSQYFCKDMCLYILKFI